jgi:hypothetical protein
MATPYSTACAVSITNNYDTVGTLTRATISTLSSSQIKALFTDGTLWNEVGSLLKYQFEMRLCGVRRYGLYDWIFSSNQPGGGKLIQVTRQNKGPSLIQPFIIGRQMSVVNADFWSITGGAPTSGYTFNATPAMVTGVSMAGPVPDAVITAATAASAVRVIRVISSYGVTLDSKYFLPGHFLYHMNLSGAGVAQHGQWQIYAAYQATDLSFIDVVIKSFNTISTTTVDATPITGLLMLGPNNVQDVEKYCRNFVNVNPVKFVPFFYKVYRWGRQIDSFYEELRAHLFKDNTFFAQFQDLSIAERNRQDEITRQKQWVNEFFFGRAISSNQTIDLWGNLEQIVSYSNAKFFASLTSGGAVTTQFSTFDPGTGGQVYAYRASPVGVYDQLKACGQVIDWQNQALNIQTFCETYIFNLVRARKSMGRNGTRVDIYTDQKTAALWQRAFFAYEKSVFGDIVRLNYDGQRNGHPGGNEEFGFQWKEYLLPNEPIGVTVNIITNEFFDDLVTAYRGLTTGTQESRGRYLLALDIGKGGSIYPAILGSNRKTYVTGELEKLAAVDPNFACVMENPTIKTNLNSEMFTTIVECPLNSSWHENFSTITSP